MESFEAPKINIEIRNHEQGFSRGTTVDSLAVKDLPVELVALKNIVRFEPKEKMFQDRSHKIVSELVEKIKRGGENDLPPVLVMEVQGGYMLLDGHHRYYAHELAESQFVPVKVVPKDRIETTIIE